VFYLGGKIGPRALARTAKVGPTVLTWLRTQWREATAFQCSRGRRKPSGHINFCVRNLVRHHHRRRPWFLPALSGVFLFRWVKKQGNKAGCPRGFCHRFPSRLARRILRPTSPLQDRQAALENAKVRFRDQGLPSRKPSTARGRALGGIRPVPANRAGGSRVNGAKGDDKNALGSEECGSARPIVRRAFGPTSRGPESSSFANCEKAQLFFPQRFSQFFRQT